MTVLGRVPPTRLCSLEPHLRFPGGRVHLSILPVLDGGTQTTAAGVQEYQHTMHMVETQFKQGCTPLSGGFDGQFIEHS